MSPTHSDVTTGGPGPAPLEQCTQAHREDPGIRAVHDRLGDKWSLLVIVELTRGPLRFRQLQRAVGGVSQRMLTLTVRRLERDGLVRRTVYPTVPAQVDYRLTAMGGEPDASTGVSGRLVAGTPGGHRPRSGRLRPYPPWRSRALDRGALPARS